MAGSPALPLGGFPLRTIFPAACTFYRSLPFPGAGRCREDFGGRGGGEGRGWEGFIPEKWKYIEVMYVYAAGKALNRKTRRGRRERPSRVAEATAWNVTGGR